MRRWSLVVVVFSMGLAWVSAGRAAEPRAVTLGNGLKVLLAPDADAHAVDVAVWYRAGTGYEKRGTTGISYLFSRLMFSGSKGYPAGAHRRLVEAEGGTVNSVVNPDFTCFYQTMPREALELALRLEADRMSALEITQDKLDAARAAVREERIRRSLGNPLGRGLEELYELAFVGHPYGFPVIGIEEDLERITLADAEAYYRERFAPQNAVLTVVGDIDPSAALALVKRHFERVPKRSGSRSSLAAPAAQREPRRGSLTSSAPASLLLVGWRGPGARDPDAAALELISHLLTAGASSRLNRALTGPGRDFVGTQGELDLTREASILLCMAAVRPGADSAMIERDLVSEVEKLAQEAVADAELEPAKRRLEASLLFQAQTSRDRAQTLGTAQLLDAGPASAIEQIERVRRLTPADLQRVAAKTLRPASRTVVWVATSAPPSQGGGE